MNLAPEHLDPPPDDLSLSTSPVSSTLDGVPELFNSDDEDTSHQTFFSETSHALRVLRGLDEQRRDAMLCDVIISVDQREFPCHRSVLAACSPYFRALFSADMRESGQKRISIGGLDADSMESLIVYTYTSDIAISSSNVQRLLAAANLVQLSAVRRACCDFLEHGLCPANCLGIHCFADTHACDSVAVRAFAYARAHFDAVAVERELRELPRHKLIELISSQDLNISSEEVVLQAAIDWVKNDPEGRLSSLALVLEHVRLPRISPYFLFDKIDSEPILSQSADCRRLLDEAKRYFVLKDRHDELQTPRTRKRGCQPVNQLLIAIGGEIYNKTYLNSVDCYHLDDNRWLRLKELPFARCHHGSVVCSGRYIYVTGGFNREKIVLNNVLRYEPAVDKWTKVANMIQARGRHASVSNDGYVYVIGGYNGEVRISSVERYCSRSNRWMSVTPLSQPISRCQATSMNGFIYVAGGTIESSNQYVDSFLRYDPRIDQWQKLHRLATPRCVGGLIAVGGKIYAVGGTEEQVKASRKLTCYDPHTNSWHELAPMIYPRFEAGITCLGNKLYVLSGHDGDYSFYHSIEEYNIDKDTWTEMSATTLPYGRCRFGCVALNVPPI